MSKITLGQKVTVHFKDQDVAAAKSVHLIDDKAHVFGEVVYVHESSNVNVSAVDHVGSLIPLLDIPTTKQKDEGVYVTALK